MTNSQRGSWCVTYGNTSQKLSPPDRTVSGLEADLTHRFSLVLGSFLGRANQEQSICKSTHLNPSSQQLDAGKFEAS